MLNHPSALERGDRGSVFKSERDRKRATSKVELRPLKNRYELSSSISKNNGTNTTSNTRYKKLKNLIPIFVICSIIVISISSHENLSKKSDNLQQNIDEAVPNLPERFYTIREALEQYSNKDELQNTQSPQYQALDWIANRDGYNIKPRHPKFLQRYILALLYFSTNGPTKWKTSKKFLSPVDECKWEDNGGVRICNDDGFVTDVSLWNNLHGTIPTEIGYLTGLKTLYLSRNKITGTIPTELGLLKELTYLGLQHNKLKGEVPEEHLGALKKLKYLMLEKNDLVGTIRKVGPLCQLLEASKKAMLEVIENENEGRLEVFASDCRTIVESREPEITCYCCTKCYLP